MPRLPISSMWTRGALVVGLLANASCVGSIGDTSAQGSSSPGSTEAPGQRPGATGDSLAWPVEYTGTPSALRRLSRDEIVATVHSLTGMAPVRSDLPDEPRPGHNVLLTSGLSFIATEIASLKVVLADFVPRAAPAMLTKSGCTLQQQPQRDCLLAWALKFAMQGLRRPMRSDEGAQFQKIVASAGDSPQSDLDAVEGVITTVFFAPSFLYRPEIGTPVPEKPGLRALTGSEIATRLSYLATLGPPDAELMAAASSGRLQDSAERTKQFDRLASTEAGKHATAVFVLEWLGANEPKVSQKSAKYLAGLPSDFEASIQASAETSIRKDVLESADATVGNLLTNGSYVGDLPVQAITASAGMGKTATGDPDATTRVGMVMHPHVLSTHTKEDGSSPFPMGLFIREGLLCESVSPPPANAQAMARNNPPDGLSIREDLVYRTSAAPVCLGCHKQFSPLGYSFVSFDPVGRWMKQDPSGKPWDLSGDVDAFSAPLTFQSPESLMRNLASSPQVHGCFAQRALEWAFGRAPIDEDQPLMLALSNVAKQTHGAVAPLFQTVVASEGFIHATAAR